MFKKILMAAIMANGLTLRARYSCGFTKEQLAIIPHASRGKAGKSPRSRSNAAAIQRAAKKRRNINKRK